MDFHGDMHGVPRNALAPARRRGRDLARLALLGVALATLWATTFSFTVRDWGVSRPASLASQAPPPALVLDIPPLTLQEAQELVARAAGQAVHSHDSR